VVTGFPWVGTGLHGTWYEGVAKGTGVRQFVGTLEVFCCQRICWNILYDQLCGNVGLSTSRRWWMMERLKQAYNG